MPLNNVFLIVLANIIYRSKEAPYQSMSIRALEVIRAVQWIEPSVQQELRPIALAKEKARRCQSVLVLRQNEVDLLAPEMLEGSDDTFWRNDRLPSKHCLVQHLWLHDLLLDGDGWVHDQGVFMEEPEVFGVWVELQGVSHGWKLRP